MKNDEERYWNEYVVPAQPGFKWLTPCYRDDGKGPVLECFEEPIIAWRVVSSSTPRLRLEGREIVHTDAVTVEGGNLSEGAILLPDGRVISQDRTLGSKEDYVKYLNEPAL